MTQQTYSLGSEPPTTHLKNGKGRNTHCRQRLQTIGNTGLLSNSLSIKVFKFFYAFDIAIKPKKEFMNLPPSQIVPKLADFSIYIASESSFYRVLREKNRQHHRGRSQVSQKRIPPSHLATKPNEVWTWDITWLKGPIKGGIQDARTSFYQNHAKYSRLYYRFSRQKRRKSLYQGIY